MNKKTKPAGKKINPIVIIVIVLVIIGGLYYGFTRLRQQRYINQLKKLYGGEASGLLGGVNQKLIEELAKETVKEEAKEKADEAKEAAKTPLDRFNETKEVSLTANNASIIKSVIEPQLTTVFGKIKPIMVSGNYLGQGDSFLVGFKISRQPTSEDMNRLVDEMAKSGYVDAMTSITAEAANIVMSKDGNSISVSYENPEEQEIGVLYVDQSTDN